MMAHAAGLAGALLCLAASAGAQARPDFSGEWVLDKARSQLQLQQASALDSGVVRIAHKDPVFHFDRKFSSGGQHDTLVWELKTDGAEVVRVDGEQRVTSSLSWAGDTLVFLTRIVAPRGEATNTVRYTLEDGGRTLRAAESFRGPRLSYDNVWVLAKR